MMFPNEPYPRAGCSLTCDCSEGSPGHSCVKHSLIVTDKGLLRMVTREQHFRSFGIPDGKNSVKARLWLMAQGGAPVVKWKDGSEVSGAA